LAKRNLAELKIPASSDFIPVAKRVATTLGSQLGLSLVDLDELTIALFASGGLSATLPKQFWDEVTLEVSPTIAAVSTCLFAFVGGLIALAEWLRRRGANRY